MSEHHVVRLFRFRPVRSGFDAILRDVLVPGLFAFDDIDDVYVGRQGPDELGERVVVSVWTSRSSMVEAVGDHFDPPNSIPSCSRRPPTGGWRSSTPTSP